MHSHLPNPETQSEFYAGTTSKRLVAWVFDSVIIIFLSLIVVVLTAFVGLFIWPLLYLCVGWIYRVATISSGSATWGMRFAGIELRAQDGGPFDTSLAIVHTTAYTVSMAVPVLQVISVIMMMISERGQGLTDVLLGSAAVNRRA